MNRRQLIATSFLAVLIVASVMSMPRASIDTPRDTRPVVRASGMVAAGPTVASELAHDQVKDLTYN